MKKELKIGDNVEMWNGSRGNVSGLNYPMITISSENSYPQELHLMNLKFINNELVDNIEVIFKN